MVNKYLYVKPKLNVETPKDFKDVDSFKSVKSKYYTEKDWQQDYDNEIDNYVKPLKKINSKNVIKNITGIK